MQKERKLINIIDVACADNLKAVVPIELGQVSADFRMQNPPSTQKFKEVRINKVHGSSRVDCSR